MSLLDRWREHRTARHAITEPKRRPADVAPDLSALAERFARAHEADEAAGEWTPPVWRRNSRWYQ